MTSKAVAKQLAMKLKLENKLKPKLRKFFKQIGQDVKIVMTATNRVPSLESFDVELTTILREHYRSVTKVFKEIPRQNIKSWATSIEKKQHFEEIPGGSDSAVDGAILAAILLLPNVIDKSEEEIVEFIISHSQKQSGFILTTTQKELQAITARVIANAVTNGEDLTSKEIAARVEKEFNTRAGSRIDTIATTETQTPSETIKLIMAIALATLALEAVGPDGEPTGGVVIKTWNTIIDSVTRPAHIRANGQIVRNNTAFIVGGERLPAPGNSSLGASLRNVINCLHPSSVVQICDPKALTRRFYEGSMVTIKTSSGHSITVTPNHPILTISGWKSAHLIDEFDHIVTADQGKIMSLCDLDIDDAKTTIEDVYNSIGIRSRPMRVGTVDMNFHGDISNSDVDIITSNCLLRDTLESSGCHVGNKIRFKGSNFLKRFLFSEGLIDSPFVCGLHTAASLVCILCIPLAILRRCFTHSKEHGRTPAPRSYSSFFESVGDNASRYTKVITDFFDRKRFVKHIGNESGLFTFSQVVEVHKLSYKGYVYNLEDSESYYIANGIVNHNCRCVATYSVVGGDALPVNITLQ